MLKPLTTPIILVIVSACALLILSFGLRSSFGLFVNITDLNQWGRETISLALAIQNLAWGLIAVVAGGLADRYGNVKVIIAGAILYGLGIWLLLVLVLSGFSTVRQAC